MAFAAACILLLAWSSRKILVAAQTLSGTAAPEWNLQKENVCFAAANSSESAAFQSTVDGVIAGVRLVYRSGYVTCDLTNVPHGSHWGCGSDTSRNTWSALTENWLLCTVVIRDDAETQLFPTSVTEGIEFGPHAAHGYYKLGGATTMDSKIELMGPRYAVRTGERFRVIYGEVLHEWTMSDNKGAVCLDVYFMLATPANTTEPPSSSSTTTATSTQYHYGRHQDRYTTTAAARTTSVTTSTTITTTTTTTPPIPLGTFVAITVVVVSLLVSACCSCRYFPRFRSQVGKEEQGDEDRYESESESRNHDVESGTVTEGVQRHDDPAWAAVTLEQLNEFRRRAKEELKDDYATATMHTVSDRLLLSLCSEHSKCYAHIVNGSELKKVNVFVSHAWGENFDEFVESINGEFQNDLVKPNLWICALALVQSTKPDVIADQLGTSSDPFSAPFSKALQAAEVVLVVRNAKVDLYTRIWCCWEMYVAYKLHFVKTPGKLKVTGPSRGECHGKVDIASAQASKDADKVKILFYVLSNSGDYEAVNNLLTEVRNFTC